MPKRKLDDCVSPIPPSKRLRPSLDRLSGLSDELLLRILHHLPIEALATCHRTCQRLRTLAADSQIWKAAYFDCFVRPRLARMRKSSRLRLENKLSRWLDDSRLVESGNKTDWKRQFKIRHNWSKGSASISEIPVATDPPVPPLLARLHAGVIYTVDSASGLRAWSYKDSQTVLSSTDLPPATASECSKRPTALTVDTQTSESDETLILIGFDDGSFAYYSFDPHQNAFSNIHTHSPSSLGKVTAVALAHPFLSTMTDSQTLSLYRFAESDPDGHVPRAPVLLTSLKSGTAWPPLSLDLRAAAEDTVLASIAFSVPLLPSGWSTGVQEVRLSAGGELLDSRLASAIDEGFYPSLRGMFRFNSQGVLGGHVERPNNFSKPTSLSYCHPYLLVSHADNTLTLYLVHSTPDTLSIAPGKRLWGHTSSVFAAHVGGRGKAVSVSSRGEELRVWELEGMALPWSKRSRVEDNAVSINISPDKRHTQPPPQTLDSSKPLSATMLDQDIGLGWALDRAKAVPSMTRGWVGVDEENVVVLRENSCGNQALAIYDFT